MILPFGLTPDLRCSIAARVVEGFCVILNVSFIADELESDEDDSENNEIVRFMKNTMIDSERSAVGVERLWFNPSKMKAVFENDSNRDMSVKVLDYFEEIDCGLQAAIHECGVFFEDDDTISV